MGNVGGGDERTGKKKLSVYTQKHSSLSCHHFLFSPSPPSSSSMSAQAIVHMGERVEKLDLAKRRQFWAWLALEAGAQLDQLEASSEDVSSVSVAPPTTIASSSSSSSHSTTVASPAASKKRKEPPVVSSSSAAAAAKRNNTRQTRSQVQVAKSSSPPPLSVDLFTPTTAQIREFLTSTPECMWTSALGRAMWERCIAPSLCFGQNREDKTHELAMRMLFEPLAGDAGPSGLIQPRVPKGVHVAIHRYTGESGKCHLCHSTHPLTFLLKFGALPGGLSCGSKCAERFEACARLLHWVMITRKSTVASSFTEQELVTAAEACGRLQRHIMTTLGMDGPPTHAQRTGIFADVIAQEQREIASGKDISNRDADDNDSNDGDNHSDVEDDATNLAAFVADEGDVSVYGGSEEEEEEEEEEDNDDEEYCDRD
jgi:hypothetical protein